jgi:hypothetical protein
MRWHSFVSNWKQKTFRPFWSPVISGRSKLDFFYSRWDKHMTKRPKWKKITDYIISGSEDEDAHHMTYN